MSLIVEDGSVVAGAESYLSLFEDRIHDTSQTTGTGTITLDETPPTGFRDFSAIGDGNSCKFLIDDGSGNWEIVEGKYTDSAKTLSRVRIVNSSNSGSLVNFASGSKDVVLVATAEEYTLSSATAILGEGTAVANATGNNTKVLCVFGSEEKDVGGNMSAGTTYTAPATGAYLCTATVRIYAVGGFTAGHSRYWFGFRKNSTLLHAVSQASPFAIQDTLSTDEFTVNICEMHPLTAADTLDVEAVVASGFKDVTIEPRHFGVIRVL